MDGDRKASAPDIVFQAKAGTPELNCCSVNGPRALGLLCEWAGMERADGIALNYYGPGTIDTPVAKLTQTTDYPHTGKVTIAVNPKKAAAFTLALRIPQRPHQALGYATPGELDHAPESYGAKPPHGGGNRTRKPQRPVLRSPIAPGGAKGSLRTGR